MVDLTTEMAGLWAALGPAPAHRGRVILFAAAQTGEGVSTVAREFARMAAVRGRRPAWLVDGDLTQQAQMEQVAAQPDRFGPRRTDRPSMR
jgi:Mrp family chromosome partitioning ATPase